MTKLKTKILIFTSSVPLLVLMPSALVHAQFDITWTNPLGNTTADDLVIAILNAVITIAIPIVVLMIIYGGFQYATARGNAEQIKTATRTLTYAIIGGLLIIGAVALTSIMSQAICEFRPAGSAGCSQA